MRERKKGKQTTSEKVIAAFDRERDQAHEWNRRFTEQVRESFANDRPVYIERRRRPR